ncbi:MAG: hypothetical protein ACQEXX_29635 [Bacillota bacterium]
MGISYNPNELEYTMKSILKFCEEHEISLECKPYEINFYSIDEPIVYDYEDITITNNTEFFLFFPKCDEDFDKFMTIETIDTLITNAKNAVLKEDSMLLSPTYNMVYVSCDSAISNDSELTDFTTSQKWGGKDMTVGLTKGISSFGIKLTMNKLYDKYVPPVSGDDLFIEIKSTEPIDEKEIQDITESFIFECSSSYNLNISVSTRPTKIEHWEDVIDDEKLLNGKLRPLIQGKGISDVLKIFNSCNHIHDAEYLILNYTKVIEYISQTVLRKEMIEDITKKLYSPKALNPDANYILDLEKLYSEHRNYQKDHHAIKITVATCCDIMDIMTLAPNYLKQIKKLNPDSSKEGRSRGLEELASAISDTRNMIAHAKTNYNFKGTECPRDQLMDFANCLKVVASQAIRWFSRQHEDSRIV